MIDIISSNLGPKSFNIEYQYNEKKCQLGIKVIDNKLVIISYNW